MKSHGLLICPSFKSKSIWDIVIEKLEWKLAVLVWKREDHLVQKQSFWLVYIFHIGGKGDGLGVRKLTAFNQSSSREMTVVLSTRKGGFAEGCSLVGPADLFIQQSIFLSLFVLYLLLVNNNNLWISSLLSMELNSQLPTPNFKFIFISKPYPILLKMVSLGLLES